ncbi:MAG: DUF4249 domain-containing protein, partial [Bacteroidota bacterium]|nr:DUF4249 domain-containing protein [Bacteroidota bacterium]
MGVLFMALFSFFLSGCERDIDIALIDEAPKLVVEATIENGQPPVVLLTRSLAYFSSVSPQILAGSFVRGAQVSISNGVRIHQLKEYTRMVGGLSLVYY